MHRPHCIKGKQCLKLLDGNKKITKMKTSLKAKLQSLSKEEMKSYVGGKTITITLPTITCVPDKSK
jgi:hypothetical protein